MPKLTLDDGQEVDVPYTDDGAKLVDAVSEAMPTVDVNYAPAGSSNAQDRVQSYAMGDLVEEPSSAFKTDIPDAPVVGGDVVEGDAEKVEQLAGEPYPSPEQATLLDKEATYPLEEE
tara:strand:- start:100 stop:450 length:351 start_codon:yes stop_codon:yes gene_type:complete